MTPAERSLLETLTGAVISLQRCAVALLSADAAARPGASPAAPDLLAAARLAYDFIRAEHGDAESQALGGEHVSPAARPAWHALSAAIARAEGAP